MGTDRNKYYEVKTEIISFTKVSEHVYSCFALSEKISRSTPGQFITVQVEGEEGIVVLRRPFAISYTDRDKFEFLFSVRGRGTKILTELLNLNQTLNVLGPLGNGFYAGEKKKKLLIAGGIGIAPLKRLSQFFYSKGNEIKILWGNRNGSEIFGNIVSSGKEQDFLYSTDDGSFGYKGTVLDLLKDCTKTGEIGSLEEYDIFAVGPDPMMKAVSEYAEKNGARCQISLETPMACGIGVCQGCAIKKRNSDGYYLACKDGPVFFSDEIEF